MFRFILIFLFLSFSLADGWVKVEQNSFIARLESFLYKVFRASGDLKDKACNVYISKNLIISGKIAKNNINLKIHPENVELKGKFDENNNLILKIGDEIFASSHIDVGANMQINIFDGTKMIIREDARKNLDISSNAKPFYELAIICAYLAK